MYRYIILSLILTISSYCNASDHADGSHTHPSNDLKITGLFGFIENNNLIMILGVNPKLEGEATKYQFSTDASYNFYIDYDSIVDFSDTKKNQLFGGTLPQPKAIQEDISISIKFDKKKEASNVNSFSAVIVSEKEIQPTDMRIEALVRDDPFTFPSVHGHNIGAIVISIPLNKINIATEQPLLLWATVNSISEGQEMQVEHVGRALRSQFPNFQKLNNIHPSEHEAAGIIPADVMIYDRSKVTRLPNGRALIDDTLEILCNAGDSDVCGLKHRAQSDYPKCAYSGSNDKVFLAEFPYLPEPH